MGGSKRQRLGLPESGQWADPWLPTCCRDSLVPLALKAPVNSLQKCFHSDPCVVPVSLEDSARTSQQ